MRQVLGLSLLLGFGATSCNSVQKGACKNLALAICDECDLSDSQEMSCDCLIDGEISGGDAEDYFGDDDDRAERWCFDLQASLSATYQTHEDVSVCRQQTNYLREFGEDACEDWGYQSESSGGHDQPGDDGENACNACNACGA